MATEWFTRAQRYEAAWGIKWLAQDGKEYIDLCREFFDGDVGAYETFLVGLRGKRVLEVGCGPSPSVLTWPAATITLIEPLWAEYAPHLPDLPANVVAVSERGEEALLVLAGQIDGAIVCRNCVDHTDNPKLLLARVLEAAAPGCTLLYWSAYAHLTPDEGHRTVCDTEADIRALVSAAGFDIIRDVHCCPAEHTRDWGCLARRR